MTKKGIRTMTLWVIGVVILGGLACLGCSSESPVQPSPLQGESPSVNVLDHPSFANEGGKLTISGETLPFVYGPDGVGVYLFPQQDHTVCARFEVSHATGMFLHLALFKLPNQELYESKVLGYAPGDVTRTICLNTGEACGPFQEDAGVGNLIPANAVYDGHNFLNSQEVGIPCGSGVEETPTPEPTSTPHEGCEKCALPTPTPTITPTPTPTPVVICDHECGPHPTETPTPRPTSTPSPSPTGTPTVTPSPTSTPRPTPTNTPVPTPSPTPGCGQGSFSWNGWTDVNPPGPTGFTLTGSVIPGGSGVWNIYLYAGSSHGEYESNHPDYQKVATVWTCGQGSLVSLSYVWEGHPSENWWIYATNGTSSFKSPEITNPHN